MTLGPTARVLLTDALRPPPGYSVDVAVGTTYTMNLVSLLLAPLSFALFDEIDYGGWDQASEPNGRSTAAVDPARVLDAATRYADRTTVFCQAGGIHARTTFWPLFAFIEDSVLEVIPPHDNAIFHPKIWAIRYVDQDQTTFAHRLVVLSRNMTLDRSWDTAVVLDEASGGQIDAAPAAEFLMRLPDLAVRQPIPEARLRQIVDLADSIASATFAAPNPFTGGELLPIGMDDRPVWPFQSASKLLAISPFLTAPALNALGDVSADRTIVSRPESLELVGSRALTGWKAKVLQQRIETTAEDDVGAAQPAGAEVQEPRDGLHAKTFILDLGRRSMVVTGSANLTSTRWGGSVEFDVKLLGPTRACGVDAVLDGVEGVPGLAAVLDDAPDVTEYGVADPSIATSYELEAFHRLLAVNEPVVAVEAFDGDGSDTSELVEATLSLKVPQAPAGSTTRVWLATLPADIRPLADELRWRIAIANVTPFIGLETTAGEGAAKMTRRCMIKATLVGDLESRRQQVVRQILLKKQDAIRYLVFLLGDPEYDLLLAELAGLYRHVPSEPSGGGWAEADPAILEALVRAVGRDSGALERVNKALPDIAGELPTEFGPLWDVVWRAHQELRT